MGKYSYSKQEEKVLKVMKMNQDDSLDLLEDQSISEACDEQISSSEKILKGLGFDLPKPSSAPEIMIPKSSVKATVLDFEQLASQAESRYEHIELEDLLNQDELNDAYRDLEHIREDFSRKTGIINKTDLTFLGVATALQVTKALLTPLIAEKFEYGAPFDESKRLDHNDKTIEANHRNANKKFKEKHADHPNGKWQNILYQTVPYDTTVGSPNIKFNMEGKYHRIHTLGHDPILGWIFGTANILTDTVTLNNMQTFKVRRKPKLQITSQRIPTHRMFQKAYHVTKEDYLNLPAALFAQYQHLKSDEFTKIGLPVPLLEVFAPTFAGDLYKSQYDALCAYRDVKIIGVSATISTLFNMIIGLIHGLFYMGNEEKKLYEVKTRKILLISNSIATTSNIIEAVITSNPKNLDIGGLLVTISRLFSDLRFIAKIQHEYIESRINENLQKELLEIDEMLSFF